jgi:hypothetical protein
LASLLVEFLKRHHVKRKATGGQAVTNLLEIVPKVIEVVHPLIMYR